MGKFNLHRGSLQLRVLTLTLLFTLGVSIVITVSNMHQLNAEWERTTLLNAEYALQTAAAAIYRDLDEVDDLASWCAYNPSMRTYLLTDSAGNNQALSMYPMISAKYNSMRTLPYIQRFMLINAAGRPMMFGTAATNVVALTPELLQTIPGYNEASYGWAYITRDLLALTTQAAQTIPICRALTLPGTDRTAHVCIFVSPSVITAPLRGFTLSEGGKLLWEMGEHIYTVQNNTLTELDTDRTYYKDTRPFDAETLDSLTEVYERSEGIVDEMRVDLVLQHPVFKVLLLLFVLKAAVHQGGDVARHFIDAAADVAQLVVPLNGRVSGKIAAADRLDPALQRRDRAGDHPVQKKCQRTAQRQNGRQTEYE